MHCSRVDAFPPPGRGHHCRSRGGRPRACRTLTLASAGGYRFSNKDAQSGLRRSWCRATKVMRQGIVPDVLVRARGREAGLFRACDHLVLAASAAGRSSCAIAGSPTARSLTSPYQRILQKPWLAANFSSASTSWPFRLPGAGCRPSTSRPAGLSKPPHDGKARHPARPASCIARPNS